MDYQVVKDFELEQNENGWTLTKYVGFDVENMEIPSEIDGKKITVIGKSLFAENENLKNVKVQSGIEIIEDSAFYMCDNLESVELANTLKKIGESAFYYCGIQKIVFPNTLEEIGEAAFNCNIRLKKVILPDSVLKIGKYVFTGCQNLCDVVLSQCLKTIPESAFKSCDRLTHIVFPKKLEFIEAKAFCSSGLKTLQIPPNIKKIEKNAFEGCLSLESVFILPGSNVSLSKGAFVFNLDLRELHIPASVTDIEDIFYTEGSYDRPIHGYAKDALGNTIIDKDGNRIRTLDYEKGSSSGTKIPHGLTAYCEANSAFMAYARKHNIKCLEYREDVVLSGVGEVEKERIKEQEDAAKHKEQEAKLKETKRLQEEADEKQNKKIRRILWAIAIAFFALIFYFCFLEPLLG